MVNDERPASFQVPKDGSFEAHCDYHEMLLKEFEHTVDRASSVPPFLVQHRLRVEASEHIVRRIKFHYLTAIKQLDGIERHLFRLMYSRRV